jgi:hypothetical protein
MSLVLFLLNVCLQKPGRLPAPASTFSVPGPARFPVCRFKQFNQKKVPQGKPAAPEKKNILQHAP